MLVPVNKLMKLNKKFALPQPIEADFERWIKYKEENPFEPVLIYYGHGLYMTCDCSQVWGMGVIYQNENGKEYLIVKDLEAVASRVDVVIVNKVLVLRQYEPGINFFHHNTVFDKIPKEVAQDLEGLPLSEVYHAMEFNELFNLMRSELNTRRRFIIIEVEND